MPTAVPRPSARRLAAKCLIGVLALTLLSGCVYLRLLRFKNQLKDFEANMEVDRSHGLSLSLKHPILRDDDFLFLTDARPNEISASEADGRKTEDWKWRFEKESEPGNHPFAIHFVTRFEDRLLTRIDFDPALTEALPPDFIVELFKSMGHAKISRLRRTASASVAAADLPDTPIPSMAEIKGIMGEPTSAEQGDDALAWRYTFNFLNPDTGETAGQFRLAFHAADADLQSPLVAFEVSGKAK